MRIRTVQKWGLGLALLVALNGCVNIVETFTFTHPKTLAGHYSYRVDLSGLLKLIQHDEALKADSNSSIKTLSTNHMLGRKLHEQAQVLATEAGLSRVRVERPDSGVYELHFDFDGLASLNRALALLKQDNDAPQAHDRFAYAKKTLSRDCRLNDLGLGPSGGENVQWDAAMTEWLRENTYRVEVQLPKAPKTVLHAAATPTPKGFRLSIPLAEALLHPDTLGFKTRLR